MTVSALPALVDLHDGFGVAVGATAPLDLLFLAPSAIHLQLLPLDLPQEIRHLHQLLPDFQLFQGTIGIQPLPSTSDRHEEHTQLAFHRNVRPILL